jgi:hypothetical protein
MIRMCAYLISAILVGGVVSATAQSVPTKTITVVNNSTDHTIFPVVFIGAKFTPPGPGVVPVSDLWMQAQFNVADVSTQVFQTQLNYRIFLNRASGIPPGGSVTVTIPFYTQLKAADASNLGKVDDQFIDWWNAARVFIFDGPAGVTAAFNANDDNNGHFMPPFDVVPFAGAAVPSCTPVNTCAVEMKGYNPGIPAGLYFQLVEYTFAAAQGPPLDPTLSINLNQVNYNISGVDNIYLPVAIGAKDNNTPANAFLGSTEDVTTFRNGLAAFANSGAAWPVYLPACYSPPNLQIPQVCPGGVSPYPEPFIPSTNTVYAETFRVGPPPAPPILSSYTLAVDRQLPPVAKATLDLYQDCTTSTADTSPTCVNIREVNKFFVDDFKACFPGQQLPSVELFLRDVYGWVQFPNCPGPVGALSQQPGYDQVIQTYCELQYNFFDATVPVAKQFNPYVKLVHQTLASNAYAFSIDDAVSFKGIPGSGVIITIGGANGLENTTQTPLPTPNTFKSFCRGGGGSGGVLNAAVLPNVRTGVLGGPPVTAFASIINTGTVSATGCSIVLPASIPAVLHYQQTDAQNSPIGSQDLPVDIPAGGTQSFVFSIAASGTLSQEIALIFRCNNTSPAATIFGVNTLLLTIGTTPIPDMLSIADTFSHDGIADIPGVSGTGVMVMSSINIGAPGSVTCAPSTSPFGQLQRSTPVQLSICQTNAQGQCINPGTPGASSTLNVAANETAFFTTFIKGLGQAIPFDPTDTRAFFICTQGALPVGGSSVALRTQ